MATSQDFDDLIARINTVTNTLENATNVINNGSDDIQQAVADAEQAVIDASQHAADASTAADNSALSAQASDEAYQDALALVQQLEAAVVLEEAPEDGVEYVRKNASWVQNSGGGQGTVQSVNTVQPDADGEVTLTPADIGALEDTYSPSWTDINGKPSFATVATSGAYSDLSGTPTLSTVATSGDYSDLLNQPSIPSATSDLTNDSGFLTDAPSDGSQYTRQDGAWEAVTAAPIPTNRNLWDGSSYFTEWPDVNPNYSPQVDEIAYRNNIGTFLSGEDVFYADDRDRYVGDIEPGNYYFTTSTFTQGPLSGREGILVVNNRASDERTIMAIVEPETGETEGLTYVWNEADGEFIAVGGSGGGGSGGSGSGGAGPYPIPNNQALKEGGEFLTEWTSDNPHDAADTGLIGFRDSSTGSYIDASTLLEGSSPEPERFSSGQYYFGTDVFTKALQGHSGVIYVNRQSNENLITAITNPADGDGAKFFVYNKSGSDFEEVGGGSSGGGGFTFSESGFYYDGAPITEWPETNPNKAIVIEKCGARIVGVWKDGAELFSTTDGIQKVPEGSYYNNSKWPSDGSPLAGNFVTIEVKTRLSRKQAVAYVFSNSTSRIGIYILRDGSANSWVHVAQEIT